MVSDVNLQPYNTVDVYAAFDKAGEEGAASPGAYPVAVYFR